MQLPEPTNTPKLPAKQSTGQLSLDDELTILGISKMLGISEPPKHAEIVTVVDFMGKYYPQYDMPQIVRAFELYCAGRLPVTGREEPKHFNALSLSFVGRVLNSFAQYEKSLPRPQVKATGLLSAPEPLTDEQAFEFIKEYKRKNKNFPLVAPYMNAYRFIRDRLALSEEDRADMKEEQYRLLVLRLQLIPSEARQRSRELMASATHECKKILVKKFIDENP